MEYKMDKLDCINLFQHVARLGSFTATANELNITQGAVSKKIAWLENEIGMTLFERAPRKISLTSLGERYLSFCKELTERISVTEQQLRNELSVAKGKLKISAPSAFATKRLAKPLQQFLLLHPDIELEVSVNDQHVDLYKDDIDVAIRASVLKDSGLKAKKLLEHQVCYFASADYINNNGFPSSPGDLRHHSCISYSLSSPSNYWYIGEEKIQINERIKSDSPEMIVEMALLGSGIAAMPKWMVQNHLASDQLVELFKGHTAYSLPMYTVYKNTEYLPFRIRALIDFLSDYFSEEETIE